MYIKLLRSMSQSQTPKVAFTLGDLHPENIVVQSDKEGNYRISGVLDWEMSGFYPDYWESIKATNTMAPHEEDDWYLYLPECAFTYKLPFTLACGSQMGCRCCLRQPLQTGGFGQK